MMVKGSVRGWMEGAGRWLEGSGGAIWCWKELKGGWIVLEGVEGSRKC